MLRTAALVADGRVIKGHDGSRLAADGSGDGGAIATPKPQEYAAESAIFAFCARCSGAHPRLDSSDKVPGRTYADHHTNGGASG